MDTQLNAYLNFEGNCREVMTFYQECLGGELTIQTVGESPMAPQCPEAMHGQVMHSMLAKGALMMMGSDMIGPHGYVKGNNMSLCLNCSSEEEINTFYNKLGEGGTIIDPLKEQFWGAMFAVLNDKYGIRWLLNYEKRKQ